jgi:hypothetical protein
MVWHLNILYVIFLLPICYVPWQCHVFSSDVMCEPRHLGHTSGLYSLEAFFVPILCHVFCLDESHFDFFSVLVFTIPENS